MSTDDRFDEAVPAGAGSSLDLALALARQGFRVFPLNPRSKEPATPNGFYAATSDAVAVERLWADYGGPGHNVGIRTGFDPATGGAWRFSTSTPRRTGRSGFASSNASTGRSGRHEP